MGNEYKLLEALRDDYYGNPASNIVYAAKKAGTSVNEAIKLMKKYDLPPARISGNKETIGKINRLLKDIGS